MTVIIPARERLPNRRASELFEVQAMNLCFTVSVSTSPRAPPFPPRPPPPTPP